MSESKSIDVIPLNIEYKSGFFTFFRTTAGNTYFNKNNNIFVGSSGVENYEDKLPQWLINRGIKDLFGKINFEGDLMNILLIENKPIFSEQANNHIYLFEKRNSNNIEGKFRGKGYRVADNNMGGLVNLTSTLNYNDMTQFFKEEIVPKYKVFNSKLKIKKV